MNKLGLKVQYEVIERFDNTKKYSIHIQKRHREILKEMNNVGDVFSPSQFYDKHIDLMVSKNRGELGAKSVLSTSIRIGVQIKVLQRKTSDATVPQWFKELDTIQYWLPQLRGSKFKNVKTGMKGTVRSSYLQQMWNFDKWLVKQKIKVKKTHQTGSNTFEQVDQTVQFKNIEDLFNLLTAPIPNKTDVVKVLKLYLMDMDEHEGRKASYMKSIKSTLVSYFDKNDQYVRISFDPKNLYKSSADFDEQQSMTLAEFMQILTLGKPDIVEKTLFVCKFHRGLDASTLVDRFNFEVWQQLVDWFGSDDHNSWDLRKCPVITEHVRIKTSFRHQGGLDRDAVELIQSYLNYREKKTGKPMMNGKPLFINKLGNAVTLNWVFKHFFKLAKHSGVLKKLPELNSYNVDSHETRDLLKSLLIDSGCRRDLADIAIGHKPDSYEKQAELFKESFRSEYAKASKRINIFSKLTSLVEDKKIPKDFIDELNDSFTKKLEKQESKTAALEQKLKDTQRQLERSVQSTDNLDEAEIKLAKKLMKKYDLL
ncbi:MAG: hypothetical protein MAG458_00271 [Nitrosopumilus sp.]|nr:hypothetical protein [Nitrosopumilus sp.]